MRLHDVSAPAVVQALREFDELGREAFLRRYKFGKARDYYILYDGKLYDSKAILGVAHKKQFGQPMESKDFSGGLDATVPILEGLGFTIVGDEYLHDACDADA